MRKLIKDWIEFCEDKAEFDSSHFLTLLHSDPKPLTDAELEQIFAYHSFNQLIPRVREALNLVDVREKVELTEDTTLLALAKEDLDKKNEYIQSLGNDEFIKIVERATPLYTSDYKLVRKLQRMDFPYAWMNEQISDAMLDGLALSQSRYISALLEALYGIANDYQIAWYILEPMLDKAPDLRYYFELRKSKADYVLTQELILVSQS